MTEEKTPYVFRPPAAPKPQSRRLGGGVFFFVSFVVVGLVGVLAAVVTWYFHPTPQTKCTENCPPPIHPRSALASGAGLEEPNVFTASAAGYHVEYPDGWKVESSSSTEVEFATTHGMVLDF